jgi:hypothetical protein
LLLLGPCFPSHPQADELPLDTVAADIHRTFSRGDYFKLGCALCVLLGDRLLTRPQRLVAFAILCELYRHDKDGGNGGANPFLPFFLEAVEAPGCDGSERQFLKDLLLSTPAYRKTTERSARALVEEYDARVAASGGK